MQYRLPTPKDLSGIIRRSLVYIVEAPDFKSLRASTTYDFTGDDVLKSIEDGISAHAKKVAARTPRDADRPARWVSYVQDARRLLEQGDTRGSVKAVLQIHDDYYRRVRNDAGPLASN